MTETMSLKALARLVFERDRARDNHRDRVSHPRADCLARQSAQIISTSHGEPGLEQPCAARRGRVQVLDGLFLHFCCQCGRFGAFGHGVRLREGRFGRWYCGEHRPSNFGAAGSEPRGN